MAKNRFCVCGHREEMHKRPLKSECVVEASGKALKGRICIVSTCCCRDYRQNKSFVTPAVKYGQGTPPPGQEPSKEPEPIHW